MIKEFGRRLTRLAERGPDGRIINAARRLEPHVSAARPTNISMAILMIIMLAMLMAVAGCGGDNPPPPPPPPPPPSGVIDIPPNASWILRADANQGTAPALSDGAFDFPVCALIINPANGLPYAPCRAGYVETPLQANISNLGSITIDYTITGDNPVFTKQTNTDNTCDGPAVIRLWLHIANDPNLANLNGRWFSVPQNELRLGPGALTVNLRDLAQWTPIYPPANAGLFSIIKASIGGVGFGFGGGCFAMHGAAVTSGTARFILNRYLIQG